MGPIDPLSSIPLYVQLVELLRSKIASDELSPGTKLPSERELCAIHDVSRITVRHAISQAESQGLVERIRGMGTFVTTPKYMQSLSEVKSFAATMLESGLAASTEILEAETIVSDFSLARVLNVSVGAPLQVLRLSGMGNETPRVLYDSYFPFELGALAAREAQRLVESGQAFSTLDLYRHIESHTPTRMEQTFEATAANKETADLLRLPEGEPVLRVESVIHGDQEPLEYRIARYRGDQYKFALERSIDLAL